MQNNEIEKRRAFEFMFNKLNLEQDNIKEISTNDVINMDIFHKNNAIACFDLQLFSEKARIDLLNKIFDSPCEYICLSYTEDIENSFDEFSSSIRYWWKTIYAENIESFKSTFIFARKNRPIENIKEYKNLKNYYWSERFDVGGYMIHELDTIELMKKACPDTSSVIELGSFHGGLTLQLSDNFPEAEIHSFDISLFDGMAKILDGVKNKLANNIFFYKENVLNKKSQILLNLLKSDKKKFLYCDNGRKIKEANRYAPYLNKGDILGVHDWGVEICEKNINKVLVDFKPILHEEAEKKGLLTRLWERK